MAQEEPHNLSVCALHSIFMPSMMCAWAFVVVSSCLSLSCFSPLFTSSLPHSICTLPCTPSPMSKTPRDETAAPSHSEEYYTVAVDHLLTGHEAQRPRRLPPLVDFCDDLPGWIRRHTYGAFLLVRGGTRRWDHRKSAIFTTVHSGARRTSGPKTGLSLCWRKFVSSSVFVCLSCKNDKTRAWTWFAKFTQQRKTKSRLRKCANQDSLWKTERANSRWS